LHYLKLQFGAELKGVVALPTSNRVKGRERERERGKERERERVGEGQGDCGAFVVLLSSSVGHLAFPASQLRFHSVVVLKHFL